MGFMGLLKSATHAEKNDKIVQDLFLDVIMLITTLISMALLPSVLKKVKNRHRTMSLVHQLYLLCSTNYLLFKLSYKYLNVYCAIAMFFFVQSHVIIRLIILAHKKDNLILYHWLVMIACFGSMCILCFYTQQMMQYANVPSLRYLPINIQFVLLLVTYLGELLGHAAQFLDFASATLSFEITNVFLGQ